MNKRKTLISTTLVFLLVFNCFIDNSISRAMSYDIVVTQTNAKSNSMTFKWSSSEAVDIYINGSIVKNNYKKSSYTYTNNKVTPATKYAVIIVPTGGNKLDGTSYTIKTSPNPVQIDKCGINSESKTLILNWIPDALICDGYQIKYYDHKGKCKKTKNISAGDVKSYEETTLSKNKFYKVKMRGYMSLAKKKIYGAYSGYRYFALMSGEKFSTKNEKQINVSFKKVTGASKYVIKVGKLSDGSDSVKTTTLTKKTSCVIKKMGKIALEKNVNYYVFIHPYTKTGKKQKKSDLYVSGGPLTLFDYIN